jgi:hypothetical protein
MEAGPPTESRRSWLPKAAIGLIGLIAVAAGLGLLLSKTTQSDSGSSVSTPAKSDVVLVPDSTLKQDQCQTAYTEPSSFILGCGMGFPLVNLKWTNWGQQATTALGIAEVDDCRPDCESGKRHPFPVSVTLTRIQHCQANGQERYLHMAVTFIKGKYPDLSESLRCPLTAAEKKADEAAKHLAVKIITGKGYSVDPSFTEAVTSSRDPSWIRVTGDTAQPYLGAEVESWSVWIKSKNGVSIIRYAGGEGEEEGYNPPIGGVPCDLVTSTSGASC